MHRFRHSGDPDRTTLWKRDVEPLLDEMPLYHNMPKYIADTPFIVGYGDSLWKYSSQYINCEIVTTSAPTYSARLGWAIPKRSPFYGTFQYHIKKIKESGAVDRSITKYKSNCQNCPDYSGKPISIQQCFIALSIMTGGFACCLLCWILECCLSRRWIKISLPTKNIFLKKHFEYIRRRLFEENTEHHSKNMVENKTIELNEDSDDEMNKTLKKSIVSENIERHVQKQIARALKLLTAKEVEMRMNNENDASVTE